MSLSTVVHRLIFVLGFTLTYSSHAMWIWHETVSVPSNRVLSNLTARLKIETNSFELVHAIARLHSLSFSQTSENWSVPVISTNRKNLQLRVGPNDAAGMPWFGHELPLPPTNVTIAASPELRITAQAHLAEAIDFYKRAITLKPTNELALLGLGWCEVQAGRAEEAKVSLRKAITADTRLKDSKFGMLWLLHENSVTEEAIHYLIPLLDPIRDKEEIVNLLKTKNNIAAARESSRGRVYTPLVVSFQPGSPADSLINTNASVSFDLDGSGVPNRKWQWITTNAAWIVHLPQGGPVTSALQMFGNVTFWMFWENGYHALASLDDNADGVLTGDELRGIRLWHDRNSDGQCTPDEILELKDLGIAALDTRYTNQNGALTSPTGANFSDGSTRPTYDIVLHQSR